MIHIPALIKLGDLYGVEYTRHPVMEELFSVTAWDDRSGNQVCIIVVENIVTAERERFYCSLNAAMINYLAHADYPWLSGIAYVNTAHPLTQPWGLTPVQLTADDYAEITALSYANGGA